MPIQSGSSPGQSMQVPGPLILAFPASAPTVSVSFSPALARIVHPQFAPVQRVHAADSGRLHVWQPSVNESLRWDAEFTDLPLDDDAVRQTQGYQSLRDFVRTTVSYSQQLVLVTSPDGDQETMRYLGGLETFVEASGESRRHLRWTGVLQLVRQL